MRTDLLVNDFVHRAVTNRAVVLFKGHFERNFIFISNVTRAFVHAMENFEEIQGNTIGVALSHTNLSKVEPCARIQEHLAGFDFLEAPIGEDQDKRRTLVSNEKLEKTGFQPAHSLDMGIRELIKGYLIIQNAQHSNVKERSDTMQLILRKVRAK